MFIRGLFVAVVCAMVPLSAWAVLLSPNMGGTGTVLVGGLLANPVSRVNDGNLNNNIDFSNWCALVWDAPRKIDLVIVEQHSLVINAYAIQVAYAAPDNWQVGSAWEDQWVTVGYGGTNSSLYASNQAYTYCPTQEIAGVRFLTIDNLNQGALRPGDANPDDPDDPKNFQIGRSRIREIWAFERYSGNNLSTQAVFSTGPTAWAGISGSGLADMNMTGQMYTNIGNNPYILADFRGIRDDDGEPVPVTLEGFAIAGGSGTDGISTEFMGSFVLEYSLDDGKTWETAFTNTEYAYLVVGEFEKPITASYWRFNFTPPAEGAIPWSDVNVRVSEIMLFGVVGAVPEPATMALLVLGGLSLLRRRR